ncbi:MAG: putative sugar nucleotidyl transferase [Bacteroidota bacterium]
MQVFLFEDHSHFDLLPFTFTRPLWALRTGIFTQQDRWSYCLDLPVNGLSYGSLSPSFDQELPPEEVLWINGKLVPDAEYVKLVKEIAPGSCYLSQGGEVLAACFSPLKLPADHDGLIYLGLLEELGLRVQKTSLNPLAIRHLPDLFLHNEALIRRDFPFVCRVPSLPIEDPHTRVYGADNIYVSPGVRFRAAILNAEDGPMYFGPNVQVQEGAIISRSHAFGAHTKISPGSKLRGDSSFGPYCKVGGEIGNSVIMGYSNKGHEGYLGNSVLGYWCNLGADTNTSNLKNNYSFVKQWHYPMERYRDTGLQFCGLMMGDHSKCGINTMFNTGTVVGVSANIFGGGFPPKFVPSFSWGGSDGLTSFRPDKAIEVAHAVAKRRNVVLTDTDIDLLMAVYQETASYRTWEVQQGAPDSTHRG